MALAAFLNVFAMDAARANDLFVLVGVAGDKHAGAVCAPMFQLVFCQTGHNCLDYLGVGVQSVARLRRVSLRAFEKTTL